MFTLSSNITITDPTGNFSLSNLPVIDCKIKKSRKTLTNTATITLPRNLKIFNNSQSVDINTIIQRKATVSIQIGYNGNLVTRFVGFVSNVGAQIPVTIDCEDMMWLLKQDNHLKSWGKGTRLLDIVKFLYPTGNVVVADMEIGGLTAKNQSTAQVLDSLKKFGLQCYFDTDATGNITLYVDFPGKTYSTSQQVVFDFYQNIIDNKLEYKLQEDLQVKITATSTLDNGQIIPITVGDEGGEENTLKYYNMDKPNLQQIVDSELAKIKYTGYRGTFTAFGEPLINLGDQTVLQDPLYPEHNGTYLTESVDISFGVDGYRQEPELERKLS